MKALIIKKGNERGRYYQGRSLIDIVYKFLHSKPRQHLIRLVEYSNHYEISVVDGKSSKRIIYIIPKDKIIN